jgi:predicted nucleic acid-binding protein
MGWRASQGPKAAFVDSTAWFAAAVVRDESNERAKSILSREDHLVTANHLIVETWTLLSTPHGHETAERFLEAIGESGVRIETVTLGDLEAARAIEEAFPERFSLSDRLSFAVMRRTSLTRVAAFSESFSAFRFGRARHRSFEILQ